MTKQRWLTMNDIFIVSLLLIVVFAYMDVHQIQAFFISEDWDLYYRYTGPAIWSLWYIVLAAIGLIWYLIYKDKSEALALALGPMIMLYTGFEDLIYFVISKQPIPQCFDYMQGMWPVATVSSLFGETCISLTAVMLTSAIGIFVAYKVYQKLKGARW